MKEIKEMMEKRVKNVNKGDELLDRNENFSIKWQNKLIALSI